MNIRFYIDPETDLPHIYGHFVNEEEVEDVLRRPVKITLAVIVLELLSGRQKRGDI